MQNAICKFKQHILPAEFRLETDFSDNLLAIALTEIVTTLKTQIEQRPPSEALQAKDAISLCNNYYRIYRNLTVIEKKGGKSKEIRSMKRAVDNINDVLERFNIQCKDFTGLPSDPRMYDFEPIASEEVKGLEEETIVLCERPAVFFNGELVQAAKGIVGKPARI